MKTANDVCGGCTKPVPSIVEPINLQEMIQGFRKALGAIQTDSSNVETLKLMMNTFTEKFEDFYNACGFTFDEEGNPILPEVVVTDQQAMIDGMISMVFILIDWSLSYGWDFNKNFSKAHSTIMASLAALPMQEFRDDIVPTELNTIGNGK
jgi:hypothetical protein